MAKIARALGLDLQGSIVSLDGVYGCPLNRQGHLHSRHGPQHQLTTQIVLVISISYDLRSLRSANETDADVV